MFGFQPQPAAVGPHCNLVKGSDAAPLPFSLSKCTCTVCVRVLSVYVVWMERYIIGSVFDTFFHLLSHRRDSAVRSLVFSQAVVVVAKRKKKTKKNQSIGQGPVRE